MQKYSQHIAEAIIPLLGFYLWGWNWYFILLFFILDGLAKEIIFHLKSRKIFATQGGTQSLSIWKSSGIKTGILSIIAVVVLHGMYFINHQDIQFLDEIVAFLSYEEMGLAQGWVLIPLVALNVWVQYEFTFLKLGLHRKLLLSELWKDHLHYRYFYLIVVVIGLGLHSVFHFQDVVFVWASVSLPYLYERFLKPQS